MEFRLLGWAGSGPRLDLDHERFAYAGNFRTGRTGIAVASEEDVVAAASFDDDRAAPDALRVRYVTVRSDRRGERIGSRLLAFVAERARERGYDRVRIGVNNPIAYRSAYAAGFGFDGEESGLGELVLERPPPTDRSRERFDDGLERFADRSLPTDQRAALERSRADGPPTVVEAPAADRAE